VLEAVRERVRRFDRALRRMAKRSRRVRRLYQRALGARQRVYLSASGFRERLAGDRAGESAGGVNPERIVWIFCTSRSGSTWLRSMLVDLTGGKVWEEPKVGQLFGNFHEKAQKEQLESRDFVLGEPARKGWTKSIRSFVLDGARYAHPFIGAGQYLIVKEPDGAVGAPLLMEALPESRMILLLRDPRDVAASAFDATRRGNWMYEVTEDAERQERLARKKPEEFARGRARAYMRQISNAKRAYDLHRGPKVLIRYEDLKADTLNFMRRACSALEIPFDEEALARVVEKHSWENVPEKEKGEGKFYRKATPGGWREDLTPKQVKIIEEVTGPLLKELYP